MVEKKQLQTLPHMERRRGPGRRQLLGTSNSWNSAKTKMVGVFFIKTGLDRKQVAAPVKINKEKYENRAFLRTKMLTPIIILFCPAVYTVSSVQMKRSYTRRLGVSGPLWKTQKLSYLKRGTSDFQYFLLPFSTFSYILLVLQFQPFVSNVSLFSINSVVTTSIQGVQLFVLRTACKCVL